MMASVQDQSSSARELERIAMLYIEGLLLADDTKAPLSPDVTRAHLIVRPGQPNVWEMASGADTIRRDIRRERLTACKDLRMTTDPERSEVVVLWESAMEFDAARSIMIMDRFVIRDGLISELEIISIPQAQPFERVAYSG